MVDHTKPLAILFAAGNAKLIEASSKEFTGSPKNVPPKDRSSFLCALWPTKAVKLCLPNDGYK
jgi:hypothetical protein